MSALAQANLALDALCGFSQTWTWYAGGAIVAGQVAGSALVRAHGVPLQQDGRHGIQHESHRRRYASLQLHHPVSPTMKMFALAALVAALVVGCAGETGPDPLLKPSQDYPCGIAGVVCTDALGASSGMCCDQGEICGGVPFSGCPAGACCNARGEGDLAGASPPHPQRPEHASR